MGIASAYQALGTACRLDTERAAATVEAARPRALAALGRSGEAPEALDVSVRWVEPVAARGGSLIPAWPFRAPSGAVRIEFVDDWGAMLATWRASVDPLQAESAGVDALLASGERIWVGIANDVLQLYVPDPPEGTYSMVRHHGLMLAAATLWLGPERARRWGGAHRAAAASFLRRNAGRPLWAVVDEAEGWLDGLLASPAAHAAAPAAVAWLDADASARARYANYLGAASLGVAALLEDAPPEGVDVWLAGLVRDEHPRPDFSRARVERLANRIMDQA